MFSGLFSFCRGRASGFPCACVRDSFHVVPGGAENTQPFCWIVVFKRERCSNGGIGVPRCGGALEMSVLLHVRANGDSAVKIQRRHTSGGCAARVGSRARITHRVRSRCVGELRAKLIERCSKQGRGLT